MKKTLAIYGIQDRSDYGFSEYIHDHSITLMNDGKVEKFVELERITRQKFDNSMHKNIYNFLKSEKLISSDLYDVVFVDNEVGRAFISQDGKIRFEAPLNQNLKSDLEKGNCWWFDKKIDAYVLNHELAHIYSCIPFYGMFKENSLLIHFDGGASLSNFSAWTWKNNDLQNIEYNWDMKYLSSLYNANALNYFILSVQRKDHNSLPGKYMGFSAYGNYNLKIEKWLIENDFFKDIWNNKDIFFNQAKLNFNWNEKKFDTNDKFLQDIAATVQQYFTNELIKKLKLLQIQTQTQYLYYTGGSALNIVTNTEIIKQNIFNQVFIPPCTSDTGLSLGAATFMEIKKGNQIKNHSPYLNNWNLNNNEIDENLNFETTIIQTAKLLLDKKIIGICNGSSEIGPRALGNRSIIALANDKKLAKKISITCKQREWYRPIAPLMLEKNAKYFTNLNSINEISKYMLLEFDILEKYQSEIEGVVHINGTSRIQTIFEKSENKFIYELLDYLDKNHNIKAIINTSFNSKGEPIVHSLNDALNSAKKLKLDALIYNYQFIDIQ